MYDEHSETEWNNYSHKIGAIDALSARLRLASRNGGD